MNQLEDDIDRMVSNERWSDIVAALHSEAQCYADRLAKYGETDPDGSLQKLAAALKVASDAADQFDWYWDRQQAIADEQSRA